MCSLNGCCQILPRKFWDREHTGPWIKRRMCEEKLLMFEDVEEDMTQQRDVGSPLSNTPVSPGSSGLASANT